MRPLALFLLLFSLTLAACAGRSGASPTPFPTSAASLTPAGDGPVILTLAELAAAPGLYVDSLVQVQGLLRRQPVVVCDKDYFPSPASWGLAEGGILTLAGGFDQLVRSLLPDDLLVTVEGRWRRWEGVVGCGKNAQQREVWYLDVTRILSPSPLTQVTLTPAPGIGGGGGDTPVAEVSPTPLPETTLGLTPNPTDEATPGLPQPTLEPGSYPGATAAPPADSTSPAATLPVVLTPGATDPAGTPAPGGTGTPSGNLTPGITGTPATPLATGTGSASGQVVERGDLFEDLFEEFAAETLAAGTVDSWTINLLGDEEMFIHTIAPQPADLVLSVLKDGQTVIDRQNNAPAGSPEIINAPILPGEGDYEIRVATTGGQATDYAIAAYTFADFPISFSGMIASGNPRSAVSLPIDAVHYWFFQGNAGSNLIITLDPIEAVDPSIDLFEPGGQYLMTIDAGVDGQGETETLTLSTTGLYAIRVSEIYSQLMTYDLEINIQ